MKVTFLQPAEYELDDAVSYYNFELPNLGELFQHEALKAISRIKTFPNAYQAISKRTRRCLIAKFPYGIIYQHNENENEIIIIAIAHLHRKPEYWQNRN
jgi:plasmid stabilization system protein ParE